MTNKIFKFIVLTLLILILILASSFVYKIWNITQIHESGHDDAVPSEKDALTIAEDEWLRVYGDEVYDNKQFIVTYIENENCWFVHGTLPKNTRGGVPEIKIDRKTGEILYCTHTR